VGDPLPDREEYRRYVYERQQRADSGHDSSLAPLALDLQAIAPGMFRYRVAAPVIGGVARPREPSEVRVSLLRQANPDAPLPALVVSDRRNLWILLLQAPIIGVVLLLAARRDALQNVVSSNGRLVLFLLAVVAVWFGVLNSVREVTKEARIYRRERLANLRISAYLFSKSACWRGCAWSRA
jgi:hypothetical protein